MDLILYDDYRTILAKIPGCLRLHDQNIDAYFTRNSIDEMSYLHSLDPANWKEQDHYRVLGLGHLRYKASADDIKKAYKRKALIHHPDKRENKMSSSGISHDYFPCMIKAFELLSDPIKRLSYDSVDPMFDDDIPENFKSSNDSDPLKCYADFYETFDPLFNLNARWSTKRGVPSLGQYNDSAEIVNAFYSFWYDFDSWREYSYLDKDDKSKGENRDERRWIEKQNRADRQKLKKEEMARIRKLVDLAYTNDPRISKIKNELKEAKMAYKLAKQKAFQSRYEDSPADELSVDNDNEIAIANQENENRQKALALERKRLLKREKKLFNDLIYGSTDCGRDARLDALANCLGIKDKIELMLQLDKLQNWLSVEKLTELNTQLKNSSPNGVIINKNEDEPTRLTDFAITLNTILKEMKHCLEVETAEHCGAPNNKQPTSVSNKSKKEHSWSELQLRDLIRAMDLYPVGTNQRWEVIANHLSKRHPERPKTPRDVVDKVKELKSKNKATKPVTHNDSDNKGENCDLQLSDPKGRNIKITSQETGTNGFENHNNSDEPKLSVWTITEQKLLEKGLKEVPIKDPSRWEKISQIVDTKSKMECMVRYKELANIIRSRKQQSAPVNGKS